MVIVRANTIFSFVGTVLLLCQPHASAQADFLKNEYLIQYCRASDDRSQDLCRAYIAGVVDTLGYIGLDNTRSLRPCIPGGVSLDHLKDVLLAWENQTWKRRYPVASMEIIEAINEKYPCSSKDDD